MVFRSHPLVTSGPNPESSANSKDANLSMDHPGVP